MNKVKVLIDSDGILSISRKGKLKKAMCVHFSGKYCQDICAAFHEPEREKMGEDHYNIALRICEQVYWSEEDEFLDQR